MPAEPLLDERHILGESVFVEVVVQRVPAPVRGSAHEYRNWMDLEEALK